MKTCFLVLVVLLALAWSTPGQLQTNRPVDKSEAPKELELKAHEFKIGQVGRFPEQRGDRFFFQVVRVIDAEEMEIRSGGAVGRRNKLGQEVGPYTITYGKPFLVRGLPTKDLADQSRIKLDGRFEVKSTKKLDGGRTVFVVEPAKK